jgi:hypothetical protein
MALPGHETAVCWAARCFLDRRGSDIIVCNMQHAAWREGMRVSGWLSGPSNFALAASPSSPRPWASLTRHALTKRTFCVAMAKAPRISDFIVSMLPPSLSALFEGFDDSQSAYWALARKLEPALAELSEIRVALLTSCTVEVVKPFLLVEGARRGLRFTIWCGPYGQIEQQVLDAGSEFYSFKPDVVFVLARLEDWAGGELQSFATERDALRQSLVKRAQMVAQALRRHSAASLLWSAYDTPRLPGVEGAPGLFGEGSLAANRASAWAPLSANCSNCGTENSTAEFSKNVCTVQARTSSSGSCTQRPASSGEMLAVRCNAHRARRRAFTSLESFTTSLSAEATSSFWPAFMNLTSG